LLLLQHFLVRLQNQLRFTCVLLLLQLFVTP
jgi:hypothetical protein